MSAARQEPDQRRDGRHLRRQLNIDAVRSTILDMLERSEPPTLSVVAERSGVTIRSIYRYFDDLDHAIESARAQRLAEIVEQCSAATPIDLSLGFEERLHALFQRRSWLERRGRPLRIDEIDDELIEQLDDDAIRTFTPELDALPTEQRTAAAAVVAGLLRTRTIRSLMEPGSNARQAQDVVTVALERVLAVSGRAGADATDTTDELTRA